MGAEVEVVHPHSRREANDPAMVEKVENMDAVFFYGGLQMRLTAVLGGTDLLNTIRERYEEGAVLSGSSAGAASMPKTMIASGESYDALLKGKVELSPGLGFVDGVLFDTHFISRGRMPSLMQVMAANPSLLGVGMGEDTAIVLEPDQKTFQVMGTKSVVVVDAKHMSEINVPDLKYGEPCHQVE